MNPPLKKILPSILIAGAFLASTHSRHLYAQPAPTSAEAPKADASKADPALAQQIADMQAKAARLQGALAQNTSPAAKKPPMGQMPAASPAAIRTNAHSPFGQTKVERVRVV